MSQLFTTFTVYCMKTVVTETFEVKWRIQYIPTSTAYK